MYSSLMIRPAVETDLDDIARLELEYFPNPLSVAQLEREIAAGVGIVIGKPLCAYALVRPERDLLDIVRLAVASAHQRRGYGGELLDFVLSQGKSVILTVAKDNWPAFRLYRRRGFVVVGHLSEAKAWVMRADPLCPSSAS